METNTTRRTLLKGIPAAAAIASVPAMAAPAARHKWEAALWTWQQAKAEWEAFNPVYDRIYAEWMANKPSKDMIDWSEFPYPDTDKVARVIDLETRWQYFLEGENKWWWAKDSAARKAKFRAALDSVQAFRDAEAKNDRDSGMDWAEKKSDALSDAESAASLTLMEMPAPDLAALRWKLDYLREGSNFALYEDSFVAQMMADIDRLLPEAK